MNTRRYALWSLFSAVALCSAGTGELRAEVFGPYLKVDGGINVVTDTDVQALGQNGKLSLDMGYRVDGAVGYEFGRWLALELEGGYSESTVDKFTLGGAHFNLGDHSSLAEIPLLLNLVVRYENPTDFVPYIGAGAGGVLTTLQLSGQKDNDAVFAWQGKVGVIYKIDEQAWLDASYKLLSAQEQEYEIGAVPIKTKEIFNHFFGISVIWKF